MNKAGSSFAALAAILVAPAFVTAAHAQASETWVSDAGLGGNDCLSVAEPCRLIGGANGALAKTVAGGLIHVLPGTYLGFTIDKSIDIIADEGQAGITTSLQAEGSLVAGISVEIGASDVVRLRGFEIVPILTSPPPGTGGIMLQSAGILHIENCTFVRSPTGFGIVFAPTGVGELYVSNSSVSDNGGAIGGGILIAPTGSGSADAVLDNVRVENNRTGILVDGRSTTGTNSVTIRNSAVAGSSTFGLNAIDSGGGSTDVMIEGSTFSDNGTQGVVSNGANTAVRMRNSTVTGNARGLIAVASGQLISGGGNLVTGNTVNGAFTSSVGQQ